MLVRHNRYKGKDIPMLEQLKAMLEEVAADDELFALMAKTLKKAHDALVAAGFTEEQATRIVAGQGIGIKTG